MHNYTLHIKISSIRKRGSTTGGAGGAPSTTRDVMTVFFTS